MPRALLLASFGVLTLAIAIGNPGQGLGQDLDGGVIPDIGIPFPGEGPIMEIPGEDSTTISPIWGPGPRVVVWPPEDEISNVPIWSIDPGVGGSPGGDETANIPIWAPGPDVLVYPIEPVRPASGSQGNSELSSCNDPESTTTEATAGEDDAANCSTATPPAAEWSAELSNSSDQSENRD